MTVEELFDLCKEEIENGNGSIEILMLPSGEIDGATKIVKGFTPANTNYLDTEGEAKLCYAGEILLLS